MHDLKNNTGLDHRMAHDLVYGIFTACILLMTFCFVVIPGCILAWLQIFKHPLEQQNRASINRVERQPADESEARTLLFSASTDASNTASEQKQDVEPSVAPARRKSFS